MSATPWQPVVAFPDASSTSSLLGDLGVYVKPGFGLRVGFGARPAHVIIDFINAFNNPNRLGGATSGR